MRKYLGLGLMSGTSLDGLDICLAEYTLPEPGYQIISACTLPYSDEWKKKLRNSIHLSGEELFRLDIEFGHFIGKAVNEFIETHQISPPDFIASHGHTVFHNPGSGYTLQIGNGQVIHKQTGIRTVYDFRLQDVILGGQGAPLVPIGDEQLFAAYDACLNLGGFSNISFSKDGERIAFDICPVNIVLNMLAEKSGKKYDEYGEIARSNKVNMMLLEKLDGLDFYNQSPPKSLGWEWCIANIFPLLETSGLESGDLLSTFTEHISNQISQIVNVHQFANVLLTGGGAYNLFLIEQLSDKTSAEIILPAKEIIEYKEALIFGWMGLLRIENRTNVLRSVTGADKNHSAGLIAGN